MLPHIPCSKSKRQIIETLFPTTANLSEALSNQIAQEQQKTRSKAPPNANLMLKSTKKELGEIFEK